MREGLGRAGPGGAGKLSHVHSTQDLWVHTTRAAERHLTVSKDHGSTLREPKGNTHTTSTPSRLDTRTHTCPRPRCSSMLYQNLRGNSTVGEFGYPIGP